MRVISWRKCREFAEQYEDARVPLRHWCKTVEKANWQSFTDVRATFSYVDRHGKCWIFNVHGNDYRLIAEISDNWKAVYIRHVLPKVVYNRDNKKSKGWKADCDA